MQLSLRRAFAVMALWLCASAASLAQSPQDPRLVAATFRSDWCGPCRVLEPRLDRISADYRDAPIEFVTFDFTLGRRLGVEDLARQEGLTRLLDEEYGATGFLLLIDRETGDRLARITMHYSDADIRGAFEHALAVVERRESFGL
ncbi:TlpA family protein disulfide reductase [Marinicauda sp. Alg238-R41]|uniref:TlpA family protein disulfide reductase n=1 Tax=Marinicauda sp. Alg238-R41 TaxID=2993447 RepID=UPI0022E762D5|nr:thioredoxin domain-containing protein [Marinicauda sp. Alg238-R41]